MTSDTVAVLELVKNCYDALATSAEVRFVPQRDASPLRLEVQDDGEGMDRSTIEEAWCVAATPYRADRPTSRKGKRVRRVSGEKGLGRLSAMRLGRHLRMFTRRGRGPCWEVLVDWDAVVGADDLSACGAQIQECVDPPFPGSGTLVCIEGLTGSWGPESIRELEDRLGRLISPFAGVDDFVITVAFPGREAETAEVQIPAHLNHPPYALAGSVDAEGRVACEYHFKAADGGDRTHKHTGELRPQEDRSWPWLARGDAHPTCGAFTFELRAWSFDTGELQEYASLYDRAPMTIRKDIQPHAGVSVYRDGVLVLPKTQAGRDWLGLDRRRVSHVGRRLDSKQIIGYVAITAQHNPEVRDTSDRERLADNDASEDFRALLLGLVDVLEMERGRDRRRLHRQRPFRELLEALSPAPVLLRVQEMAGQGLRAEAVVPLIERYAADVRETTDEIEDRLIYYSHLATIGSLAAMIVHEVRGHVVTLGRLVRLGSSVVSDAEPAGGRFARQLDLAEAALRSLERLADRFAPLATSGRGTRRRDSVVEEVVADCVAMREKPIRKAQVDVGFSTTTATRVAVDPGELMAIFINLLDNSLYWIVQSDAGKARIAIGLTREPDGGRLKVEFHDNGPGVEPGFEERIFWPGVTRKPGGIGMGLTVAAEIVSQYGGRMYFDRRPKLGGATFGFDLPLSRRS